MNKLLINSFFKWPYRLKKSLINNLLYASFFCLLFITIAFMVEYTLNEEPYKNLGDQYDYSSCAISKGERIGTNVGLQTLDRRVQVKLRERRCSFKQTVKERTQGLSH